VKPVECLEKFSAQSTVCARGADWSNAEFRGLMQAAALTETAEAASEDGIGLTLLAQIMNMVCVDEAMVIQQLILDSWFVVLRDL
jgi:hypothetical protein